MGIVGGLIGLPQLSEQNLRYIFDPFVLDADGFGLHRGEEEVHVEPLVFDLLRLLVSNPGRVLTRDEIIAEVWEGRFVSDATVSSAIKAARKALGDTGDQQAYIRTVRGRGFQFVANVSVGHQGGAEPSLMAASAKPAAPAVEVAAPSTADVLSPPRIAVLPLFPLPMDDDLRLLGDAISQELILELSRLHWLFVVARGSSFQFRGQEVDLAKAGAILDTNYFVNGTIMRSGKDCIVTIELSEAAGGNVVWADSITTPRDGLMHLRSKLAGQIVSALEPRIQLNEALQAGRTPTEQLTAWAAYHRGLWHMYRFNRRDNELAEGLFTHATSLDPNFARAHAGLSFTHFQNAFLGFAADVEAEKHRARSHADRSMELDPLDPFVNLTMGRVEWVSGNLEAGLNWMERSIALSPNYAFAIYNSALVGTLLGDGEANEKRVLKAMALSPIDPLNYAMLATRALTYLVRGDFTTAAEWAERAIRAPNAHIQIFAIAAFSNELAGNRAQADACVARLRQMNPAFETVDFFKSFHLRPGNIRSAVEQSLGRLGLKRS